MEAYLHLHSHFSLLDGTASVESLCDAARRNGADAVALADTDNAYGHVRFSRAARIYGLKAVFGARLTDPAGAGDAVCLARSREGYANLCRLVTARHLEDDFRLADALPRFAGDLFVLTRHTTLLERLARRLERSSLFAELVSWRGETHRALLAKAAGLGVAVAASPEARFLAPDDWELHRVLCAVRERTLVTRLRPAQVAARAASLPRAADFRARFATVPEALANAAAIARACEFELELGRPRFPRFPLPSGTSDHRRYLEARCDAGLRRRYRPVPRAAFERLAQELAVIGDLGFAEYFLVLWDVLRFCRARRIPCVGRGSAASSLVAYVLGITNVDPLRYQLPFERFLHRSRTDVPDIDLDLCWVRRDEVLAYVYEKYGAERTAMISTHATFQTRLAFREAAKAYGIPNEIVNRLSKALPHYAVPSEPSERLDKLYGRLPAGDVIDRRPPDDRRDPSHPEDAWSRRWRPRGERAEERPSRLEAAIRKTPECRGFPLHEDPYPTVLRLTERLVGLPRHLGIHSGGMVVGPRPLTESLPLERAAKGIVVTQPEMEAVEALGFIKMDLLGQRALTTLGETVELVRERSGVRLELDAVADPDPATAALLRNARTISCFQIESPGMRSLMRMLRVESSDELIAALALIRPGPAGSGMKERYIRRRRGDEAVVYPHVSLEPLLAGTYGIMLYQEDIMRVAHAVAGFSLEEADRLRSELEAGRTPLQVNRVAHEFFGRAVASAIDEGTAWGVWEQMKQFMGYAFCKAHAATYGVLAYQATYLKAHHPTEFYVAVLNNHQGMYPRRAHVEEAKRLGIRFLPPDVHESGARYALVESRLPVFTDPPPLEGGPPRRATSSRRRESFAENAAMPTASDAETSTPAASPRTRGRSAPLPPPGSRGTIRIPLSQVKGLTAATIERIVAARAWGPFRSLRDFVGRAEAGRDEVEALVKCGALDILDRTRTSLLLDARLVWKRRAYRAAQLAESVAGAREGADESLALGSAGGEPRTPELPRPSREQELAWEVEHLGLTVREHPIALCRDAPVAAGPARAEDSDPQPPASADPPDASLRVVRSCDVETADGGERVRTTGIAIASRHEVTVKGETMVFLTLEDEWGVVETTLFPPAYRRWGHLLVDAGPFVATGRVERHHGVATITVERLARLRARQAPPKVRFLPTSTVVPW